MFSNLPRPVVQRLAHDVADLRDLVNAHERVHFRHEPGQFVAETLRQAAGNDDGLAALIGVAQFDGFENGVHALLLRGINEGAGVDDDGVGLRGVVGDFDAALEQRAEHDFGVHQIFGAAKGNQADAQRAFPGIFLRHSRRRLAESRREAILTSVSRATSKASIHRGIGRYGIRGTIFDCVGGTGRGRGRGAFRRQAELCAQHGAGGIGQAMLRVEQLLQHRLVQSVKRRQGNAIGTPFGGFDCVTLINT